MGVRRPPRLTADDFNALVSDFATEQSERLGLGWVRSGSGTVDSNAAHDVTDPYLIYNGAEVEFSTCVDIETWPSLCWDVNGYYAALGVHFRADRREIVRAYHERVGPLQAGPARHRLTYILKLMLDPERRAKYDAAPLGHFFVDPYVEEAMRVADAWETAQRMLRGEITFEQATQMRHEIENVADLDSLADGRHAHGRSDGEATSRQHIVGGGQWRWSYFRWNSSQSDTRVLARWQELLGRYFAKRKEVVRIAVGFVGACDAPFEVRTVGTTVVVFLNDQQRPTRGVAKKAVARTVKYIRTGRKGEASGLP